MAKRKGYKILPKHPLSSGAKVKVYDYDEGMKIIDWELVNSRDYSDKECKNACMAECLALGCVNPTDFLSITVRTDEIKLSVEQLSRSLLGNYNFHVNAYTYCFSVGDK